MLQSKVELWRTDKYIGKAIEGTEQDEEKNKETEEEFKKFVEDLINEGLLTEEEKELADYIGYIIIDKMGINFDINHLIGKPEAVGVNNEDELQKAIAEGNTNIVINKSITLTKTITIEANESVRIIGKDEKTTVARSAEFTDRLLNKNGDWFKFSFGKFNI